MALAERTSPRRSGMATLLWLIDDSPGHHQVTAATVAMMPTFTLAGFLTAPAALLAFRALLKTPDKLPEIVLMDFYIGTDRGDRVTSTLRDLAAARALTIVGFSSMRSGSEAIVAAGGDVIVRKHADADGFNPTLRRWLQAWRSA